MEKFDAVHNDSTCEFNKKATCIQNCLRNGLCSLDTTVANSLDSGTGSRMNPLHVGEITIGDVLIIAHRRAITLTQYLTWFGKSPTSTGESILLEINREMFTTHMEEEDHFTLLYAQLSCCTLQCCNGSRAAAIVALFLSLYPLHMISTLSLFALCSWYLFIGKDGGSSSSTTAAAHGLMHLSMVGATTIDKW